GNAERKTKEIIKRWMRRRLKNRRRFSFPRRKISGLFLCPKKILKYFSEVRNNLRFSNCSLCEGEREIFRFRTTE
ncbi:MAG: hypothetical protein IJQ53_05740, partial [Clostridia bacterium]|nr:hypothetical protein [Clostridia bacterium]